MEVCKSHRPYDTSFLGAPLAPLDTLLQVFWGFATFWGRLKLLDSVENPIFPKKCGPPPGKSDCPVGWSGVKHKPGAAVLLTWLASWRYSTARSPSASQRLYHVDYSCGLVLFRTRSSSTGAAPSPRPPRGFWKPGQRRRVRGFAPSKTSAKQKKEEREFGGSQALRVCLLSYFCGLVWEVAMGNQYKKRNLSKRVVRGGISQQQQQQQQVCRAAFIGSVLRPSRCFSRKCGRTVVWLFDISCGSSLDLGVVVCRSSIGFACWVSSQG